MNNFWDENNEVPSELDMLQDSYNALEEDQAPQYYEEEDIDDEVLEEIVEEAAYDLDTKEKVVVYNARIRLEQAKLYEMLINHNLFEGVDASPQAIENVQNELKTYITERLEILLGMKKERQAPEEQVMAVDSPFNDVEVEFLKALAYKGTKGESATGQPLQTEVRTGIKPLTGSPKPKLKSLVSKTNTPKKMVKKPEPVVEVVEEEVLEEPVVERPVLKKKVTKKKVVRKKTPTRKKRVKKKTSSAKKEIRSGVGPRKLTRAEIDALAREEIVKEQEATDGVNWKKLSAEEKARRIAESNGQRKIIRPSTAAPMPSQDQVNAHYTMKQQASAMSTDKNTKLNNIIASVITAQKSKG